MEPQVCVDTWPGWEPQTFDQYFVKYLASVVALLMYALPLISRPPGARTSHEDITQDYIRAMRLLQNTSKCALEPVHLKYQAVSHGAELHVTHSPNSLTGARSPEV